MTASRTWVMVRMPQAGVPPSQQAIAEALQAAGLENFEITWKGEPVSDDDPLWHITVASGQRVAVGALPIDQQSATGLAIYLKVLRAVD